MINAAAIVYHRSWFSNFGTQVCANDKVGVFAPTVTPVLQRSLPDPGLSIYDSGFPDSSIQNRDFFPSQPTFQQGSWNQCKDSSLVDLCPKRCSYHKYFRWFMGLGWIHIYESKHFYGQPLVVKMRSCLCFLNKKSTHYPNLNLVSMSFLFSKERWSLQYSVGNFSCTVWFLSEGYWNNHKQKLMLAPKQHAPLGNWNRRQKTEWKEDSSGVRKPLF